MFRSLLRFVYRQLRRFEEWHEDHEVAIALVEAGAALLGTVLFVRKLASVETEEWYRELLSEPGAPLELAILVLLTVSLLARLALLVRSEGLGPSFTAMLRRVKKHASARRSVEPARALFPQLAQLRSPGSYRGGLLAGGPDEARTALAALAREAASTFSTRTYGEPDPWWEHWETEYMTEWHTVLPESVWRIPSEADPQKPDAGYFSVIVPVARHSYIHMRRGHLHAALSTIDFHQAGNKPPAAGGDHDARDYVNLLIYTSLYVPTSAKREAWDLDLIIYTPIEHLSFLICEKWPELYGPKATRGLRILAESSNKSMDNILEMLGFHLLYESSDELAHGHSKKGPVPVLSPAGFKVFELSWHPAIDAADEHNARGREFIASLNQTVVPKARRTARSRPKKTTGA